MADTNTNIKEITESFERSYKSNFSEEVDYGFFGELAAQHGLNVADVKNKFDTTTKEISRALDLVVKENKIEEGLTLFTETVSIYWDFIYPINRQGIFHMVNNLALKSLQDKDSLAGEIGNLVYRLIVSVFKAIQREDTQLILRSRFQLGNPQVVDFLVKNRFLINLIVEASDKVKEYIPSERLVLKLVSDSETPGLEALFMYVHTSLDVDDAFDKLTQFKEDWWLDFSGNYLDKINITVEFE